MAEVALAVIRDRLDKTRQLIKQGMICGILIPAAPAGTSFPRGTAGERPLEGSPTARRPSRGLTDSPDGCSVHLRLVKTSLIYVARTRRIAFTIMLAQVRTTAAQDAPIVMIDRTESNDQAFQIATRWCLSKGSGWSLLGRLGKGSTAPVFEIASPEGPRALKIYDAKFSTGNSGDIEQQRIDQLLALSGHECPFLVQVYEGSRFEDRLYLLMSRAPGSCLEERLPEIPRRNIRQIVDQVARAAIFLEGRNLCHRDIKAANIFISEDFSHCTLLDISVIRKISDPIGLGTDHDGKLPIVATARYSPPEYLFRLLEPGPDLWHALNIYQLGALLHDLIMREPLFQDAYLKSSENRYRFAWIVAVLDPPMNVADVDQDLLFLAKRALDKNWQHRSTLGLEDFLADSRIQQLHALQVLGLSLEQTAIPKGHDIATMLQLLRGIAKAVEEGMLQYLKVQGVTARHEVLPGAHDDSRLLVFTWELPALSDSAALSRLATFHLTLQLLTRSTDSFLGMSAKLEIQLNGGKKALTISLPETKLASGVEPLLVSQVISAFNELAQKVVRSEIEGGES